jgi:hypothetical protein
VLKAKPEADTGSLNGGEGWNGESDARIKATDIEHLQRPRRGRLGRITFNGGEKNG